MAKKRGLWAVAGALAALAFTSAMPAAARDLQVGDVAPDARLTLVNGEKVNLSDLRGQVVVLNFWATWCGPCREELPWLDAFYKLQQQHGMRVFAVATEDSVPAYQLHKLFAVLTMQPVRKITGPYHVLKGVPTNYVIDRRGVIRYARAAAFDIDSLNDVIVPLLREPAPEPPLQAASR